MGYYNWGEQVGNSFMSMFAQNQQKRLEEKRLGMEQQRLQQSQMQLDDQLRTSEQQRSLLGMQIGELEKTNKFWGGIPDVAQRLSDTNKDGIYNDLDTPTMVPAQFAHLTKGLSWDPYQLKSFNNGKWQEDTQWYRGDQAENFLNIYMKNQENASGTWEGQQDRANSTRNAQISAGPGYAQVALTREENNRLAQAINQENWLNAYADLENVFADKGVMFYKWLNPEEWNSVVNQISRVRGLPAKEVEMVMMSWDRIGNKPATIKDDDKYIKFGDSNSGRGPTSAGNLAIRPGGGALRDEDVSRSSTKSNNGTAFGHNVYKAADGTWRYK